MIDFHTHTLLSDGALNPSELVRRAHVIGYRAIGLTDHVDGSNLEAVARSILKVAADLNRFQPTLVVPGVEITHAPPGQIQELVALARQLGAPLVVAHGESPVEPVAPGTNRAAIEAGVDILAHPGHISESEARMAHERGVCLEITSRHGHSLTNGHVARISLLTAATMVINTDTHSPENLISRARALQVLIGAGLTEGQAAGVLENNEALLRRLKERLQTLGIV
ncbi:MAG: histidinol phosphate phosphatase domain-containing protein [Deltaproteobacteria bacterium]|nr:histidinol phosphate phosphatase domain-containing protein [Deltaproteobacteria bacterium]